MTFNPTDHITDQLFIDADAREEYNEWVNSLEVVDEDSSDEPSDIDLGFDDDEDDIDHDWDDDEDDWDDDDDEFWSDEDDYEPDIDEYTEWQDVYEGDDWDHGQYDDDGF